MAYDVARLEGWLDRQQPTMGRSVAELERHLPGKHDQSTHGRGKGGVRKSLANAQSTDELNGAISAEAERITGRPCEVNLTGVDQKIAAEFGEGILRGMEARPDVRVDEIKTYGLIGKPKTFGDLDTLPHAPGGRHPEHQLAIAFTAPHTHADRTGFYLNTGGAQDHKQWTEGLQEANFRGHFVADNGIGIGMHEFGHMAADGAPLSAGMGRASKSAHAAHESVSEHVSHISGYAAANEHEMMAEAFADVMINGKNADPLSWDLAKELGF